AAFDQLYSTMLAQLQKAWDGADQDAMNDAIGTMHDLKGAAVTLMNKPRPDGLGNYGPAFRLVAVSPSPAPVAAANVMAAAAPAGNSPGLRTVQRPGRQPAGLAAAPHAATAANTVPTYARIQQLLDEAIHGETIGAHGPFWRTLTRDQFVAKSIFGKKLIAA